MRRSILTAVALGMFLPISGRAQEMPTASKWTDVEWYQVVHIDFKYGKRSDALRIIREHLAPAGEEAGTPPPVMSLHHETGQWDLTTIWHMSGPSELEWGLTPNGEKWWAAFAAREGGIEQARQIYRDYQGMIARRTSYIARQPKGNM
jgi:hypothetical protein